MKVRMTEVDSVLVRDEIFEVKFSCDLSKCKGACCTMESDYGAPLMEEEIELIEKTLPVVEKYLSKEKLNRIREAGFYEIKNEVYLTQSVKKKDCVFVYYENDIAKCAIEKAYFNGETDYRKPVSCHLFPIRISDFGGEILRYEEFSECKPALKAGAKNNTTVADFCKESLERVYGTEWYQKLVNYNR